MHVSSNAIVPSSGNEQSFSCLAEKYVVGLIAGEWKAGIRIQSLTRAVLHAVEDAARLLLRGQQNRHTSSTNMNRESSRSHSVFTCVVESKTVDEAGLATMLSARVNLVDLAGKLLCNAWFCGDGLQLCLQGLTVAALVGGCS